MTGELAPMIGRGLLTLTVGGLKIQHLVWIANVQDSCILGLDFLREHGCQLDLSKATLSFCNGQVVRMRPPGACHTDGLTIGSWACDLNDGDGAHGTVPPSVPIKSPCYCTLCLSLLPGKREK